MYNKWKNTELWKKNILSLVLGIIVGLLFKDQAVFLEPFGNAFMNLLKMMVTPLIFITLIHTIVKLSSTKTLINLSVKAIIWFNITSFTAIMIAIFTSIIVKPGVNVHIIFKDNYINNHSHTMSSSLLSTIFGIIPSNPFQAFVEGNVLQVMFLAIFVGIITAKLKQNKSSIIKGIDVLNDIVFNMVHTIVKIMPIGIFVLIAYSVSVIGYNLIVDLSSLIVTILVLCLLQVTVVNAVLLRITGNSIKDIRIFFKGSFQAVITAFSSSSSSASLPVSIGSAEKMGIDETTKSLILPLATAMNRNGTAIQQTVIAIFVAQMVGFEFSFSSYLMLIIVTLMAVFATPGIPSAGLIMSSVVLKAFGLPLEVIGVIAGVDRIIDMVTTATNVAGDLLVTKILSLKKKQSVLKEIN